MRIFCAAADLPFGCVDKGSRLAAKKPLVAELPEPLRTVVTAPMPVMLALLGRPY